MNEAVIYWLDQNMHWVYIFGGVSIISVAFSIKVTFNGKGKTNHKDIHRDSNSNISKPMVSYSYSLDDN